jgi:hypothetical protein
MLPLLGDGGRGPQFLNYRFIQAMTNINDKWGTFGATIVQLLP